MKKYAFDEIICNINEHISVSGHNSYEDFYIGITSCPEKRFLEHKVNINDSWSITMPAIDSETARKVEKYFLCRGMNGGDGGGNDDSIYVYCYIITPATIDK